MNPDDLAAAIAAIQADLSVPPLEILITRILTGGSVEDCYSEDLARALAAYDDPTESARIERRLRAKFGRELNLNHYRAGIKAARRHLLRGVHEDEGARWTAQLISGANERPAPIVANALIALRQASEWVGVLVFNKSALQVEAKNRPPAWPENYERILPHTWTDEDDVLTASWLQHQGIMVTDLIAAKAVQTVACEHAYHPVRDYLNGLRWDGDRRLDSWLSEYLGAEPNEYTSAVGSRFLIGAAARIFQPGCKNDTCLVLEGPQGGLKSTALKTLTEPWFTDSMPTLGTKDAQLQTRGVWLIELAELDAMSRAETETVKAFMSRSTDRFRPPFGRRPVDVPRECVFAASTNRFEYLRDETGGRRFWPVRCGTIDVERLERDRDQLWAEAVELFKGGAPWWLDKSLERLATEQQTERYESDAWDAPIRGFIEGKPSVSIDDILDSCLKIPMGQWTQGHRNRVAKVLRTAAWERFCSGPRRARQWRYRSALHSVDHSAGLAHQTDAPKISEA